MADQSKPLLQPTTKGKPDTVLDAKQQAALDELKQQLPQLIPAAINRDEALQYCSSQTLQRYLRARKWNVKQAAKMLQATFSWRFSTYRPQDIRLKDLRTAASTGNNFVHGHDKQGRPVMYLIKRGHPGNDLDNIKLLVYNMELAAKCMPAGMDKLFLIIDLAGHNRSNATPLSISKLTLDILTNHYPERLGVSYLVNAPSLYSYAWNLISPFLDSVTKSKIKFATVAPATMHDPSKNVLLQEIGEDQLITRYGGKSTFVYDFDHYEREMEVFEGLSKDSDNAIKQEYAVEHTAALAPAIAVAAS